MFKVGDRVKRVTTADRPDLWGIKGQEYIVLEAKGRDIVVIAGRSPAAAAAFELVESAGDAPESIFELTAVAYHTVLIPPPHICTDNRKTYDSGWSRYDYCAICDQKIKETV